MLKDHAGFVMVTARLLSDNGGGIDMTHIGCNMDKCRQNGDGECKARWVDVCDEICMTYEVEAEQS